MKFDLAGVAKRVEDLRRELRDLRSRTDGLAEGKSVRLVNEEIRKQRDEMRQQRDQMKRFSEDIRLQRVEVKQSMKIAKTPVEHRHPSLEEKVKFLEEEHQREKGTMRHVSAQMEQKEKRLQEGDLCENEEIRDPNKVHERGVVPRMRVRLSEVRGRVGKSP